MGETGGFQRTPLGGGIPLKRPMATRSSRQRDTPGTYGRGNTRGTINEPNYKPQVMKIPKKGWKEIPWAQAQVRVQQWQRSIYEETKKENIKTVRRLQHRIVNSLEAKVWATRRVTQDNKGKATAGVDGVVRVHPNQRLKLALSLKLPTKSRALRREDTPVAGGKGSRPLMIATIRDRCLQALMKLALEPEWEARFEANSYGGRPGRSTHDAIKAVHYGTIRGCKYVLSVDLAAGVARIDHDALLEKTGLKGGLRRQVKSWLKVGVLGGDVFEPTEAGGVEQPRGVISPLLANIALHGLEHHLKNWIATKPLQSGRRKPITARLRRMATLQVIRYGYDFVILHPNKEIILGAREEVERFLATVGLSLSDAVTRLAHTLRRRPTDTVAQGFDGTVGFDFLSFTCKQAVTLHHGAKAVDGRALGYRTFIVPTSKVLNDYQARLHDIVLRKSKAITQGNLIRKLNPIVRGWTAYFGMSHANTMGVLAKQDYLLYLKLRRWAKRRTRSARRGLLKYWSRRGDRRWVFQTRGLILENHQDHSNPITTYVKVKGERSPYDDDTTYWVGRRNRKPGLTPRIRTLSVRQKGCCNRCGLVFIDDDVMEVDHITPTSLGGGSDLKNLQLLHRHCHQAKTTQDVTASLSSPQPGELNGKRTVQGQ